MDARADIEERNLPSRESNRRGLARRQQQLSHPDSLKLKQTNKKLRGS
jgi:hypothetical protein